MFNSVLQETYNVFAKRQSNATALIVIAGNLTIIINTEQNN